VAVRVTDVRRISTSEGAELLVSLKISREGTPTTESLCLCNLKSGGRSELSVEMEGSDYDLKDHRIPPRAEPRTRLGRVSIPADANRLTTSSISSSIGPCRD